MSKTCNGCKKVVEDDTVFCPQCGNKEFLVGGDYDAPKDNSAQQNVVEHDLGKTEAKVDNGVGFDSAAEEHPINDNGVQTTETTVSNSAQVANNGQVVTPTVQSINNVQPAPAAPMAPNNGVIDNNFFAQQQAPVTPRNRSKKKSTKIDGKTIWTVCGIIGTILLVISVTLFILLALAGDEGEDNSYDPTSYFTEENSMYIGDDRIGYIKVPNTWQKTSNGVDLTSIIYTDDINNGRWYIQMDALDPGITDAQAWANETFDHLNAEGLLEVGLGQEKINSYDVYKVVGFDPNTESYTVCWFFQGKKGDTKYVAINSTDRVNDLYNMIYTFVEKK